MNSRRPGLPLKAADWPLAVKLSAAVVALLIPATALIMAVVLAVLQNSITAQIGNNLTTLAKSTARGVSDELAGTISSVQALARSQTLIADVIAANSAYPQSEAFAQLQLKQMAAQWDKAGPGDPLVLARQNLPASLDLRVFLNTDPNNRDLFVTDRYGGLVAITAPPEKYRQSSEPWWEIAYNNGSGVVYISPPYFDQAASLYVLTIAVPVYRPNSNEVIGIVHTNYRLQNLVNQMADVKVGETGEALLLTRGGARLDTTASGDYRIPAAEWEQVVAKRAAPWLIGSFEEQQSLVTIAPVTSETLDRIDDLNWVVVIRQDLNESLAAQQAVVRVAAIIASAGLVIIILFTVFLARLLVRPIAELTGIANQAQGGNLEVTATVAGRDEIGQLSAAFNAMITEIRNFTGSLEAKVAERTAQLSAVNEIAATVSTALDINQVLTTTVNLIRDRLGYYHVSIFLLDEKGETAVLRESTGEVGRLLKERGHRLGVGSQSIIGYVTANRKPRIALDVGADAVHFKNPLLPDTRSEMALPLALGETFFGALDVQSTEPNAFDDEDVAVLQNMANQIAIAINNARLYQEAQIRLEEISLLNRQYLSRAWEAYSKTRPESVSLVLEGGLVSPAPELITQAKPISLAIPTLSEDGATITIPISLRDEVIGEFSLSAPVTSTQWSEDELVLVEAVVGQVALAVENARLLEETQAALSEANRLARRERIISEITNKITFGADVKRILQIAADELRRATGSSRAVVRLTTPTEEAG